jgi:CRP-like cAMP-binding protein
MFSPCSLVLALETLARADALWNPIAIARGAKLMSQGELRDSLFVLTTGLVKLTYLSADGEERIKSLIVDVGLFGALDRGEDGSRFGATALEASTVVELPGHWLRRAVAEDATIAAKAAEFTKWLAERKQFREEALLCRSAEERYRDLLTHDAELVARLPQGDIARFLAVTPIAFSRIKRRVRDAGFGGAAGAA